MVGSVAQVVALAAHGNAYLRENATLDALYPGNSTFQHCRSVTFVDASTPREGETAVAATPTEWLVWLKSIQCQQIYVAFEPTVAPQLADHISSAFVGGGGVWRLDTRFYNHFDGWVSRWEQARGGTRDDKPWRVSYRRVLRDVGNPILPFVNPATQKVELERVLVAIRAFATRHGENNFARMFADARGALHADDPLARAYHKDIVPPGGRITLESRQLLAACNIGWVFGGMGSWNDLGFESDADMTEYERLSAALYAAIAASIESAVNSFGASPDER